MSKIRMGRLTEEERPTLADIERAIKCLDEAPMPTRGRQIWPPPEEWTEEEKEALRVL
ncbi:MAG: hypothetical protein Q8K68_09240 [Nitrospirota bacterium]|nr:hypothetical protein [Nitrospirota bacterium]